MTVNFDEELREASPIPSILWMLCATLTKGMLLRIFNMYFQPDQPLILFLLQAQYTMQETLDSGEEIFVVLYTNLNDTAPRTILPEYITRAGTDGKFRIDNIAEGEYAIYGLLDLNNNKIYDLDDETFAFIDSTITLSGINNFIPEMPDSLATAADSARYLSIPGNEYRLFHFRQKARTQYLSATAGDEAYKMMFVFKQALDSGQFAINFIDSIDVRY